MRRLLTAVARESRITLQALAGGWPGLLLFAIIMLVAFTIEGR